MKRSKYAKVLTNFIDAPHASFNGEFWVCYATGRKLNKQAQERLNYMYFCNEG